MNEPNKKNAKKSVSSDKKETPEKLDATVAVNEEAKAPKEASEAPQRNAKAPEAAVAISSEGTAPREEAAHADQDSPEQSQQTLQKILKKHIVLTGAAGLIPTPIIDVASITAIQANMIKEIANHFGVEFKENLCRNIIGALVTGTGVVSFGTVAASSLMKSIPLLGTFGGMLTMPIIAGASTYALGKVFIEHFENGGTLLDFKPETAKEQFKKEYQEGKKVAANLKDEILQTSKCKSNRS